MERAGKLRWRVLAALLVGMAAAGTGCKGSKQVDPATAARVWELTSDDPAEVQAAVDFLLSQDRRLVVPALMENVADLHQLKVQSVVIQDFRDPAKPRQRYHPKKFCDLVALLLHCKTGKNFGYIYDGAKDVERVKTIARWQQWWGENRDKY